MTYWQALFQQENLDHHQASFDAQGNIAFPEAERSETAGKPITRIYPLPTTSLLQVIGADSKKFLQGQTTCNMEDLSDSTWLPGAICDPKGRMITSFSCYPCADDHLLLEMAAGLAGTTITAIEKYAAFFKAELSDQSSHYAVIGLAGPQAAELSQQLTGAPLTEGKLIQAGALTIAQVGEDRFKLIVPTTNAQEVWQQLRQSAQPTGNQAWQLDDIHAGIGQVSQATSGELIPQMINLQARNGISFRKGCYTGQEIVARMKYLGKLKRWMHHLQLDQELPLQPGTACFGEGSSNAQGTVVDAATNNGKTHLLAVLTESLSQQTEIRFGEQAAIPFTLIPLPYSLENT